jgi:hypothetical protein
MIEEKIKNLFDFRYIKTFEVKDIADTVASFSNEWFIDTSRQDNGISQRETFVFWIADTKDRVLTIKNEFHKVTNQIFPIIDSLEKRANGVVARALLAKLEANSQVYPHKDSGRIFESGRRFHVPIITNNQSYITVNDVQLHMMQGECWEINNCAKHSAKNLGQTDRVHLIVDVILKEYL